MPILAYLRALGMGGGGTVTPPIPTTSGGFEMGSWWRNKWSGKAKSLPEKAKPQAKRLVKKAVDLALKVEGGSKPSFEAKERFEQLSGQFWALQKSRLDDQITQQAAMNDFILRVQMELERIDEEECLALLL